MMSDPPFPSCEGYLCLVRWVLEPQQGVLLGRPWPPRYRDLGWPREITTVLLSPHSEAEFVAQLGKGSTEEGCSVH